MTYDSEKLGRVTPRTLQLCFPHQWHRPRLDYPGVISYEINSLSLAECLSLSFSLSISA